MGGAVQGEGEEPGSGRQILNSKCRSEQPIGVGRAYPGVSVQMPHSEF